MPAECGAASEPLVLFAGSANPALATRVADRLGVALGAREVERFPDGEVSVRLDVTMSRRPVFVLQPTSPPVDRNVMELLAFADAARRAAATSITAIIPYFGYSRANSRNGRIEPVASPIAEVVRALVPAASAPSRV